VGLSNILFLFLRSLTLTYAYKDDTNEACEDADTFNGEERLSIAVVG